MKKESKNLSKIRKLHQILQSGFPVNLNKNLVRKINVDFDLELEFNENDELIIKGSYVFCFKFLIKMGK